MRHEDLLLLWNTSIVHFLIISLALVKLFLSPLGLDREIEALIWELEVVELLGRQVNNWAGLCDLLSLHGGGRHA